MELSVHSVKLSLADMNDVPEPSNRGKERPRNFGERVEEAYINDPHDRPSSKCERDQWQVR